MQTYYESAEGVTITARRAWQEFRSHGLLIDTPEYFEFAEMIGNRNEVKATEVLDWLGY